MKMTRDDSFYMSRTRFIVRSSSIAPVDASLSRDSFFCPLDSIHRKGARGEQNLDNDSVVDKMPIALERRSLHKNSMDADEDSFKTESSSEKEEDHWLEEGEIKETESLQFHEKKLLAQSLLKHRDIPTRSRLKTIKTLNPGVFDRTASISRQVRNLAYQVSCLFSNGKK